LVLLLCFSCKEDSSHSHHDHSDHSSHTTVVDNKEYRDSSTIEMAQYLSGVYQQEQPLNSNYRNAERAELFLSKQGSPDVNQHFQALMRGAFELVNAGHNERAIKIYDQLLQELSGMNFPEKPGYLFRVKGWRAITNLRLAEAENCLNNHNRASCLIPFQKEAYHKKTRGGEAAIKDILEILKISDDYNMRYLLNFAYMILGKYPESVPKKYLIPLSIKEKDTGVGRFQNIASEAGIDDGQLSGGVVIDDLTGNGHLDILCSSWNLRDQLKFYINNGDGSYSESHIKAGLKGITGGLNMTHADYDNDGDLDVLILRGAWLPMSVVPNSLLRNNGDGTFTDVTKTSGIFSLYPTQTAAWADFDNDGLLDIYIGNESLAGLSDHPCELYLNQGDGTFTEIAAETNSAIVGYVKGVCVADYDNDNDPDIFISVLNGKNILLRNNLSGSGDAFSFEDVSEKAGIQLPLQSFPCWFFDYDNNGTEDLFVASYPVSNYNNLCAEYSQELMGSAIRTELSRLYSNNGDGTFTDKTYDMGFKKVVFAMGCGFGDMNNDGFLDMYIGTGEPDLKAIIPNRAFLNEGGKKFEEITAQAGLGHVQKGHAIAFADMDQDGDEDIYAVMGGAYEGDGFYNALFENPGHGNQSLKVKLVGTASNKFAIGARLRLDLKDGDNSRSIHRTVSSGSSFGQNPHEQHFGFLASEEVVGLKVQWPQGRVQEFGSDFSSGHRYTIKEGEDNISSSAVRAVSFQLSAGHHHHH